MDVCPLGREHNYVAFPQGLKLTVGLRLHATRQPEPAEIEIIPVEWCAVA